MKESEETLRAENKDEPQVTNKGQSINTLHNKEEKLQSSSTVDNPEVLRLQEALHLSHQEKEGMRAYYKEQHQLTEIQMHYETCLQNLMPAALRRELEETIAALRAQICCLEKRIVLLDREFELNTRRSKIKDNSTDVKPRT
uniref:centrosomal protein of 112 kDa-like n=1 Tax=Myxine glutinosa TaxID=7769 RepID=UPI003590231D